MKMPWPGPSAGLHHPKTRQWVVRFLGSLLLMTLLAGCAMFATGPLDVLTYEEPSGDQTYRKLFVFMRGMGGSHRSFEEEGLVAGVRARGLPFDMAAPDAHFGYYSDRTLTSRLKADVIDPARAKGYQQIWLIGFSLGGLGSLLYLMEHPEDIEGICLISPFVGTKTITDEIESAGGVRKWNPGVYKAEKDWERMLWHWLKTGVADNPAKNIYLGYGLEDPYVGGQQLLATILPKDHVNTFDGGGHDYYTFKTLWNLFLDSGRYNRPISSGDGNPNH